MPPAKDSSVEEVNWPITESAWAETMSGIAKIAVKMVRKRTRRFTDPSRENIKKNFAGEPANARVLTYYKTLHFKDKKCVLQATEKQNKVLLRKTYPMMQGLRRLVVILQTKLIR
jgi:hypothetical protein